MKKLMIFILLLFLTHCDNNPLFSDDSDNEIWIETRISGSQGDCQYKKGYIHNDSKITIYEVRIRARGKHTSNTFNVNPNILPPGEKVWFEAGCYEKGSELTVLYNT